ncbi:MIP transporter [Apiospora saccharicola]
MAPRHTTDNIAEAHLKTGTTMKRDVSPGAPRRSSTEANGPAGGDGGPHDSRERLSPQALETHGMDFTGSFARNARPSITVPIRPWYRRRSYFTDGWTETYLWKAAVCVLVYSILNSANCHPIAPKTDNNTQIVEAVASFSTTYLSAQFSGTLANSSTSSLGAGAVVGIWTAVMLSTLILATAPATGGHINPMITWTTMLCGLCPVPRAVLYMMAQTTGAALAGGFLVGSWGLDKAARLHGGGCFYDPAGISTGQVLLTDIACGFILLGLPREFHLEPSALDVFLRYLSFGVGLDPDRRRCTARLWALSWWASASAWSIS